MTIWRKMKAAQAEGAVSQPDIRRDWPWLAAAMTLGYACALGLRLLDISAWDTDLLRVGGEYIMGTHDAYAWLAGARGVGTGVGTAMAKLLLFLESLGVPLGDGAFWSPAVVSALVAVVIALWAWTLGGVEAGLCAAAVGALAPGYYARTRLGFYDTDMVTLLFPLFVGWMLAHWLSPWLVHPSQMVRLWRGRVAPVKTVPGCWWPLGAGGVAWFFCNGWHTGVWPYVAGAAGLAVLLAVLLGRPGGKAGLLWGALLFFLPLVYGPWGGVWGVGVAIVLSTKGRSGPLAGPWPAALALMLLVVSSGLVGSLVTGAVGKMALYSHGVVEDSATKGGSFVSVPGGPAYPGVIQSVVEASVSDWRQTMARLSPDAWLSCFGIVGLAVVVWVRPVAVFLVPLAGLGLLAGKYGARFSMFGGPPVMLGLTLPLVWFVRRSVAGRWRRLVAGGVMLLLGALFVGDSALRYREAHPTPVLSKPHAVALKRLENIAPAGAQVWTWWDYGYAAQYYSGLETFSDGARHEGWYLLPLGVALGSPDVMQSWQMMKYCGLKDNKPWTIWNGLPAAQVNAFVASMAMNRYDMAGAPPQYLVVTWDNVNLIPWITRYGSWDLEKGRGLESNKHRLKAYTLNRKTGELGEAGSGTVMLSRMEELTATGRRSVSWNDDDGAVLLVNRINKESILLDSLAYRSMAVRMLICDPADAEINEYFDLVYEAAPMVRIYRLR